MKGKILSKRTRPDNDDNFNENSLQLNKERGSLIKNDKNFQQGITKVLNKLTGRTPPDNLVGLEEQLSELEGLIGRTLKNQESNSVLLVGPFGSGKSSLLNLALKSQLEKFILKPKLVKLSGLIHTDDKSALISMAHQLKLDVKFEDEDEEEVGEFGDNELNKPTFNFSKALEFVLDALTPKVNKNKKTTVIVILDQFDQFASHTKQALLYNLFDLVQRTTTLTLLVIGMTSKVDALDLLEKRVKSRFSHRQINVFPPRNFPDYMKSINQALTIPNDFNCELFNNSVKNTLKDPLVISICDMLFNHIPQVGPIFTLMTTAILSSSIKTGTLTSDDIRIAADQQGIEFDTLSNQLQTLTLLELGLIVSMKKWMDLETDHFTFEMIYKLYDDHAANTIALKGGAKPAKKPIARKALERLIEMELVSYVETNQKGPLNFALIRTNLQPNQILEALEVYPNCPTSLQQWAKS